jgi:hypothetical protein
MQAVRPLRSYPADAYEQPGAARRAHQVSVYGASEFAPGPD